MEKNSSKVLYCQKQVKFSLTPCFSLARCWRSSSSSVDIDIIINVSSHLLAPCQSNMYNSCETSLTQVYYCGLSKLLLENSCWYLLMYLDQYSSAHVWFRTHQYFLDWSGVGRCIPLLHCPVVLLYTVIF